MRPPVTPSDRPDKTPPLDPLLKEMEGCEELGMKRETLRLASRILRQAKVTAAQFKGVVSALLTTEDRLNRWRKRVEDGYARLGKRGQRGVRFWMLLFYHSAEDYRTASQFIPKHFHQRHGLIELSFAWEIWLELKDEQSLARHFEKVFTLAQVADCPTIQGRLFAGLGNYCIHRAWWRRAVDCFKQIPAESTSPYWAVVGPLLALAGEFLSECSNRREALKDFQRHHNPDLSSSLAMEMTETNRKIGREVRALESGMRRLLGRKRLKSIDL